ncbi:DUF6152 family protein [Phenylobacterium hankyongense]|uniref:DUF6152 family protein n=1 Tax=Phenylobacterium hankyongense TaxID=1813876 RepID=UPI0010580021|nr:DUF6152 family protein [Phenylobacterium hankyongense]
MGQFAVNSRPVTVALRMAVAGLAALGVSAATSGPALAHHSFAMFDQSKKVQLQGTVKDWQFTNPHSWLQLLVDENGHQIEYSIEGASVNTLIRRGWGVNTFKPGDKITIVVYPIKTGQRGGAFLSATLSNGKTISSGITPN